MTNEEIIAWLEREQNSSLYWEEMSPAEVIEELIKSFKDQKGI